MSRIWTNSPAPARATVGRPPVAEGKPGKHRKTKHTARCYKAAELIDARRTAGAR